MNEDIVRLIEDNYPLSEDQEKIWESVKEEIKGQKKIAVSSIPAFNKKLSQLGDSHTYIKRLESPQEQFVVDIVWQGNSLIWTNEAGKYAIEKINGKNLLEILEKYRKDYGYAEPYVKRQMLEDIKLGIDEFQKDRLEITYLDNGRPIKKELLRQDILELKASMSEEIIDLLKKIKTIYSRKICEDTFYIKISSFYDREITSRFIDIVKTNVDREIKNIIIDIRDNSGGYVDIAKEITSFLIERPLEMDYEVVDKFGNRKRHSIQSKLLEELKEKNIWLFVNQNTQSSAEYILGRGLKLANSKTCVVGQHSAGMSGQAREYILDNSIFLSVTTKRYVKAGTSQQISSGVMPDIKICEPDKAAEDLCMKWYLENKCVKGEQYEYCIRS